MRSYHSYDDEYLFILLKDEDEKAFTELYDRYWKKLLVRANILLRSQEDAEELVHDIFVTLWNKREKLHILNSFYTYIAAMLQYGCYRVLAKRRQFRKREMTGDVLEQADLSTQQWLDFEDLREELEIAVSRLPERCRLIFRLSREEDLSDKEIAQELQLSVHTVRTQMHRALQKLKTAINIFFFL